MNIVVTDNADRAAKIVAATFVELLSARDGVVLGLAAGRSPEQAYRLLVEQQPPHNEASVVMLDEYVGLGPKHRNSFRRYIRAILTDRMGLDPSRVHSLDGTADDLLGECARFEATIAGLGGVDLQLLGLGRNGHIGFNEPGSPHDSRTRLVRLSHTTRADNASAFGTPNAVPHEALTQGIGTILEARRIILLAVGSHKAEAVAVALEGPVSEAVPASALQRHGDVTVILDRAAAAQLSAPPRRSC